MELNYAIVRGRSVKFIRFEQGHKQVYHFRVEIETGLSDGINIEITEGLKLEDKVKGEKIDPKKLNEETSNQG